MPKKFLKTYFGYDKFLPLQANIINNVLAKKDNFVLMPTGGGKSLCFQLPALKFKGTTIVVSPLIALMKDQVDGLKENGIPAEFINSSLQFTEINRIQKETQAGKIKILYIAPERLASPNFQEFLKTLHLSLIAIDEAHCISEWGHDFRPDYRNLKILKNIFPQIPTIALTATATEKVKTDIIKQLSLQKAKQFISSFDRKNLNFTIIRKKNAFDKLLKLLLKYKNKSVIIYCFSRKETEAIALDLKNEGFKAKPYHAGLDSLTRKKNQELFIKDKINIIVATIAFGMGIDKPDVRLVLHYSFPKTLEGYYQEIGRAGRDGLPAECVMFYTYADARKHEFFINQMNSEEAKKSSIKLKQVMDYADLNSCRRKFLLNYFGEEYEKKDGCGGCDYCLRKKETFDATIITQKILSTIIRSGNRFGANYIIDILKGSNKAQIKQNNHNQLSVFGIVNDFENDELKHIIKLLIFKNLIQKSDGQYPTLSITKQGQNFLNKNEKIFLDKPPKEISLEEKEKQKQIQYNTQLFEQLKQLRKQIANEKNVPPFVIFGDASLQEMAFYFPNNLEQFLLITGVGEQKLNAFGNIFLKIINQYILENNIQPIKISSHKKRNTSNNSNNPAKEKGNKNQIRTIEMIKRKINLEDIANIQGFTIGTIINHIDKFLDKKNKIDLNYLKPEQEKFNEIKKAFIKCGVEALKPAYEFLKEKHSYDDLRLVRVILKSDG